jgi:hypothetical protein
MTKPVFSLLHLTAGFDLLLDSLCLVRTFKSSYEKKEFHKGNGPLPICHNIHKK